MKVTLGALLLVVLAMSAEAQLYKCVDEKGKTRYTDQPQTGCKESAIKGSAPISGELAPKNDNIANQEAELRRRQLEREQVDKQQRLALEQRCGRLRQEQKVLASGLRIAQFDAKGERVFMEDAARQQRLAQLELELRGCP